DRNHQRNKSTTGEENSGRPWPNRGQRDSDRNEDARGAQADNDEGQHASDQPQYYFHQRGSDSRWFWDNRSDNQPQAQWSEPGGSDNDQAALGVNLYGSDDTQEVQVLRVYRDSAAAR